MQAIHKKYHAGNKYHLTPLEKSQKVLKNHRKKNKSAKYGFDQKDIQVRLINNVLEMSDIQNSVMREI